MLSGFRRNRIYDRVGIDRKLRIQRLVGGIFSLFQLVLRRPRSLLCDPRVCGAVHNAAFEYYSLFRGGIHNTYCYLGSATKKKLKIRLSSKPY